jgi:putative glycosyltransferase
MGLSVVTTPYWLLGGLTLLSLGIVGLYVSRTLVETERRPYAIVRQVHDASGDRR